MVKFGPKKHQSPLTGPNLFSIAEDNHEKARAHPYGSKEEVYHTGTSIYFAVQAAAAALVMVADMIETNTGNGHYDLAAWHEAIGLTYPSCDTEES